MTDPPAGQEGLSAVLWSALYLKATIENVDFLKCSLLTENEQTPTPAVVFVGLLSFLPIQLSASELTCVRNVIL